MNNRRTMLLLATIFAVLVVVVWWQGHEQNSIPLDNNDSTADPGVSQTPDPTEPSTTFTRLYTEMAVLDIQAIRLEDPNTGEKFTISRSQDGNWTAPDSRGELDLEAASNIARTVALMLYERSIPTTEETDLSQYGFGSKGRLLIQTVMNNGESHAIAIGAFTPSGNTYYAVVNDKNDVYLLERGQVDFLINYLRNPPLT